MKKFRQASLKPKLEQRAEILQAIRLFFIHHGYLEVETPIRIPAPAPESHIDAEASGDWFLQTSPELCMKRLLAAGYSKIFQICRCFRQFERGQKHLPELTLLEWYVEKSNYLDVMKECEELIGFVVSESGRKDVIPYQGHTIDIRRPWERISVKEAFDQYADKEMEKALEDNSFDEIMGCDIEPNLGLRKPVFLYDYPAEKGALARLKTGDRSVAERFELYIAGLELCNAFSELADPYEQRRRFEEEMNDRVAMGKIEYPMPEPFLESLCYFPEAAGIALGVDRLVMLLTDSCDIDDVTAFVPEEL